VDGPDFDGHKVDFDELLKRQGMYLKQEKIAMEKFNQKMGLHTEVSTK